jgi:protein involved in polysaccharide export with SLBB domain
MKYFNKSLLSLVFLGLYFVGSQWACAANQAELLGSLTPAQLQQLQQLSPEQRAALAQQAGGNSAQPRSSPPTAPQVSIARPQEVGRLETEIKTDVIDERVAKQEVKESAVADIPVVQVGSQQAADKLEIRRSYEEFTRESKPLEVSTANLRQFGYDLFSSEPTTFAPVTDVPVPPEYVLGPGDEIKVQLFGSDNRELALTVDRQGSVSFPQIGPISVAGLSFAQGKALLAEQIKQKMIGVSASITMGQLRSIRIFALGDVYRPGSYTVSGLATLSSALFASGGVKKIGSLRKIELKRKGRIVTTIDLYDFLLRGDTSKDVRLLPGDVVFVPPISKTVSIAGEVVRPAIYEMRNESTVSDILKLAGGLLPKAYLEKALIERIDSKGEQKVINLSLLGNGANVPVHSGDVVKVFAGTEFENNQILMIGNLKRPGKYAWVNGMRVSSLINSVDDLLPETFMDYGVIEREAEATREPMIIRFKLGEILAPQAKGLESDLVLQSRDRVYIFKRATFRQQPKVSIQGTVQAPGEYEFKLNMRLADLVLAAGGLLRQTDLGLVEVYRTDPQTRIVQLYKVNLALAMAADTLNDIQLQDLDRVVVHSIYETKLSEVVSISGQVNHPDTVPLTKGMRVSDLVFAGGSVTEFAFLKKARLTRFKVLDGEKRVSNHLEIDLTAALKGDEAANLLLEPYDSLTVGRVNDEPNTRDVVSVTGEVLQPTTLPLSQGMRVSDLVFAGGGVTEAVFMKKAEITRYKIEGAEKRVSQRIELDLGAAMQGDAASNVLLQPHDVLMVRRLSNWRAAEKIEVRGEVLHPGIYPVEEGERLSTVLERVGGYTKEAFLTGAVFIRESVRQEQQKQLNELVRRMESETAQLDIPVASLRDEVLRSHREQALETSKRLLAQLKSVNATGRMVIELSAIENLKDSGFDIQLRDGDKLYIPKQPDEVLVVGEVYNQSALLYHSSKDYKDYLNEAAPTRMADKGAIYFVRANGKVEADIGGWFVDNIGPGDTIVVPQELDHINLLDVALDWSRATMQIGTSIAAMKAIGVFK